MATLVVTSDSGCVAAITDTVFVRCKPSATFTVNNVCTYTPATFTNTSTGATTYSWDFDYNTGIDNTTQSPAHLYAPGNYNVQLIARSPIGCSDTIVHPIVVYAKPVANFLSTNPCFGQAAVFNDSSKVVGDTITGWSWNFGDNSSLVTNQNSTHNYANSGTYPVSLIATTNKGCIDTVLFNVKVHPLPNAQFSATNVCNGNAVPFHNLSTIAAPDLIQSYSWDFADATAISHSQDTPHQYATEGSYGVQLLAVSNFGCRDSITKTIIVNPNPVVKFVADKTVGCSPLCLAFSDSSSVAGSSITNWTWTIGDGSAVTHSQNFDHCYKNISVDSNARYTVTLRATSDSGCFSTLTKNNYITVYPNPKAIFGVQPQSTTIEEPLITITDLSEGGSSWKWNFGDQSTANIFSPLPHTYNDTGSYTITLITSTQYGCIDTTYKTVIIEPDFAFYIPNAFSPNDDGINDTFNGKGIFIKDYEMMIYDRWGNLIFYTNDINKPWDGKANQGADMAQRDVYIYVVNLTDILRKKHSYKGTVTLVR
jgi:gliding motility-associated-like protein